jgi:hypothetical protein
MLLSFPAANGEAICLSSHSYFEFKLAVMSAYGISLKHAVLKRNGTCGEYLSLKNLMWQSSENVFEYVAWAFVLFKIVKRIAIIRRQKNNMARRHIDFGPNKKM